jgi:hypothetical protein
MAFARPNAIGAATRMSGIELTSERALVQSAKERRVAASAATMVNIVAALALRCLPRIPPMFVLQ